MSKIVKIGSFLIVFFLIVTVSVLLNNEKFENTKSKEINKILKSLNIDIPEARKLFKPASPNLPVYEYIKKDSPTMIKIEDGKSIIIPPLIAVDFQDPRKLLINIFKTNVLIEDKNNKKENFIPNINEIINNYRLNLPRGSYILNTTFSFDIIINDVEYDDNISNTGSLAENIRGFSIVYVNNIISIYTGNRDRLLKYNVNQSINSISPNLFNQSGFIKNKPSNCSTNSKWGYGQVSYLKRLDSNSIDGILCPIICSNGSRIELTNSNSFRNVLGNVSMNEDIRWIAYDPISGYVAVPITYNVSKINIYDFTYNNNILSKRLILTSQLLDNNGNEITLNKVTSGCFDKEGILYLLSNDENRNNTGIYIFDSNDSMRTFRLKTRLNRNVTDSASGSDKKYVGLGVDLQRNIYCLVKNEDFGDDNISLFKLTPNFILPAYFNWADSYSVMANRGINFQISPVLFQAACGSCWAFALASTLSDRMAIAKNEQIAQSLSATRIISCDKSLGHCNGAQTQNALELLEEKGTVLDSCWNYNWCYSDLGCNSGSAGSEFDNLDVTTEQIDSLIPSCLNYQNKCVSCDNSTGTKRCTILPGYPFRYKTIKDSYRPFMNDINNIKTEIFNNGPIIGSFMVKRDFLYGYPGNKIYRTNEIYCHMNNFNVYGIRDYQQNIGGHAVEIVGWGRDLVSRAALGLTVNPGSVPHMYIDYWIIKNSWGQGWGTPFGTWGINNKGYAKVAMQNINIGLNMNLGFESPRQVNVIGLTFDNFGCFRFLADNRSPYPPDMCEYRCPNFLLERKCPGQRNFTETTELCYHD